MSNNENIQNFNNIFAVFPKYEFNHLKGNYKEIAPFIAASPYTSKDTFQNEEKNGIKKKTVASSVLTAGILALLLAKGFHGSLIQKLGNETMYYAKKGTDRTFNVLQAASNFTAVKDLLFDKIFRKNNITAKYAQNARNFAKKVVDGTLSKQYDKAGVKINDITSLVQKYNIKNIDEILKTQNPSITIKGVTKNLAEWREDLIKHSSELQECFNEGFSLGARQARSDLRDNLLKGLAEKIYRKLFKQGKWKNPDTYKAYITEVETRDVQKILKDNVTKVRKNVTNNIDSIHDNIKSELSKLKFSINPKDKTSIEIYNAVKKNLDEFKNCSGINETEARKIISDKMIVDIDKIISKISKGNMYSNHEKEELILTAEKIKLQLQTADKKGALENLMTVLKGLNSKEAEFNGKKVISDFQFRKFDNLSKQISSTLNQAADKESGVYFLKQAEMEVGSAATDIFSILFPIGVGAYAVGKCNNNDERISATLKTCIPLIGMFSTFIYGTTKMLAGAKNLIFSSISAFILNKFGAYIDELYKNYKISGSVVNVAKSEYTHVWSDLSVGINGKNR